MNKNKKTISYYVAIIIGLIMLLSSIVIDTSCNEISLNTVKWIVSLFSKLLSTIGLSLAISGIMVRINKPDVIESILNDSDKKI